MLNARFSMMPTFLRNNEVTISFFALLHKLASEKATDKVSIFR